MERADKIFTILALAGMVAVLVTCHRSRGNLSGVNLNESATDRRALGPSYLLSNLPLCRERDEYAPPVSYEMGC